MNVSRGKWRTGFPAAPGWYNASVARSPDVLRWASLNNLVLKRYPHRADEFAHGNDGGLFEFALLAVRTWGGVLEHPAYSRAWHAFGLPRPAANAWQLGVCGGWGIELDQHRFGHPARKLTWLYAFGFRSVPPRISIQPSETSQKGVRVYRRRLPDGTWARMPIAEQQREISHACADHTPALFARWLVDAARLAA